MTLAWGVLITAVARVAGSFASNVITGINRVGAHLQGPLLAAFACGILDRRAAGLAIRVGVTAGLGVNLLLLARARPSAGSMAPSGANVTTHSLAARLIAVRSWALGLIAYTAPKLALLALPKKSPKRPHPDLGLNCSCPPPGHDAAPTLYQPR